jgi:hypothetical protein
LPVVLSRLAAKLTDVFNCTVLMEGLIAASSVRTLTFTDEIDLEIRTILKTLSLDNVPFTTSTIPIRQIWTGLSLNAATFKAYLLPLWTEGTPNRSSAGSY